MVLNEFYFEYFSPIRERSELGYESPSFNF